MGSALHLLCPREGWAPPFICCAQERDGLRPSSAVPKRGMGSALHLLCPRYNGPVTSTAPTAIRKPYLLTLRIIFTVHSYLKCFYCISSVIRQSFFSLQNNLKNLDPSYKLHLDLWLCLEKTKFEL